MQGLLDDEFKFYCPYCCTDYYYKMNVVASLDVILCLTCGKSFPLLPLERSSVLIACNNHLRKIK